MRACTDTDSNLHSVDTRGWCLVWTEYTLHFPWWRIEGKIQQAPKMYFFFFRDLDGNKICAFSMT